jgi:MtN3 and saliva related transmembrane protein
MNIATIIGLTAGTIVTLSFLPQVIKTWKTKETKDISLIMYIFICTGMILWLIYGILINEIPIIAANGVSLILALTMVFLKVKYK